MINLPKSSQQLCDDLFERLAFASECEKKGQKARPSTVEGSEKWQLTITKNYT